MFGGQIEEAIRVLPLSLFTYSFDELFLPQNVVHLSQLDRKVIIPSDPPVSVHRRNGLQALWEY